MGEEEEGQRSAIPSPSCLPSLFTKGCGFPVKPGGANEWSSVTDLFHLVAMPMQWGCGLLPEGSTLFARRGDSV